MPDMMADEAPAADAAALSSGFTKMLVRQVRAHDAFGAWDKKSDSELLADFIVTRKQRRSMPIIADPDAKTLWRLELFYNAVSLTIAEDSGIVPTPIIKLSHEGYGRVVLIAGRLVVIGRQLRDVHRFGFETLTHLAAEGEGLVASGLAALRQFPEVAKAP